MACSASWGREIRKSLSNQLRSRGGLVLAKGDGRLLGLADIDCLFQLRQSGLTPAHALQGEARQALPRVAEGASPDGSMRLLETALLTLQGW